MGAEDLSAAERLRQKRVESWSGLISRATRSSAAALSLEAPKLHERRVARLDEKPLRFAFVENIEMRWDVRLEGKEPQQPLGEGVQRLNLEAAGSSRWCARTIAARR